MGVWRMRKTEPKLTRAEAQSKLESFTEELKTEWQRDGLDWAPDLLNRLFEFNREAAKDYPDWVQLELLRKGMRDFIGSRKFLKGISNILEYADTVCQREAE